MICLVSPFVSWLQKNKKLKPPNRYPKWYRKQASIISEELRLFLSWSCCSFGRTRHTRTHIHTHRSDFLAPLFFLLCIASALLRCCSSCAHSHLVSASSTLRARTAPPRHAALTSRLMSSRQAKGGGVKEGEVEMGWG